MSVPAKNTKLQNIIQVVLFVLSGWFFLRAYIAIAADYSLTIPEVYHFREFWKFMCYALFFILVNEIMKNKRLRKQLQQASQTDQV